MLNFGAAEIGHRTWAAFIVKTDTPILGHDEAKATRKFVLRSVMRANTLGEVLSVVEYLARPRTFLLRQTTLVPLDVFGVPA